MSVSGINLKDGLANVLLKQAGRLFPAWLVGQASDEYRFWTETPAVKKEHVLDFIPLTFSICPRKLFCPAAFLITPNELHQQMYVYSLCLPCSSHAGKVATHTLTQIYRHICCSSAAWLSAKVEWWKLYMMPSNLRWASHVPNIDVTDCDRLSHAFNQTVTHFSSTRLCGNCLKCSNFVLDMCYGPFKWCVYVKPQHASALTALEIKQTLKAFPTSLGLSYFFQPGKLRAVAGCVCWGDLWFKTLNTRRNTCGVVILTTPERFLQTQNPIQCATCR